MVLPFIIFIASMNEDMFVLSKLSLELAALEPMLDLKWFKPDFKSSNLRIIKKISELKNKTVRDISTNLCRLLCVLIVFK